MSVFCPFPTLWWNPRGGCKDRPPEVGGQGRRQLETAARSALTTFFPIDEGSSGCYDAQRRVPGPKIINADTDDAV